MLHVNSCLDEDENATLAANQLADRQWTHCPICLKTGCTLNHLRKCAKDKKVLPRDVVDIVQRFEKEIQTNGVNAFSKLGKKAAAKPKKEPTAKKPRKAATKKNVKTDDTQIVENMSEEPVVVSSFFISKSMTATAGKIIAAKEPLTRQEIDSRVNQIIKYSVVDNYKIIQETVIPRFFGLASLDCDRSHLICQAFESRINVSDELNLQERKASQSPTQGFLPETTLSTIEIKETRSFLDRLRSLRKDRQSMDVVIQTRGDSISCHSFLWSLNTNCDILHGNRIDLSSFSHDVVNCFICYCYDGVLKVPMNCLKEMLAFVTLLGCHELHSKLNAHLAC